MCIVFLDYQPVGNGPYLLILANNRDEFYHRPAAPLDFWSDNSDILAGRDLDHGPHGGTWLGINKQGRFSVLTNWRKEFNQPMMAGAKSRGYIVSDYLQGIGSSPQNYCEMLMTNSSSYERFNLLVGDLGSTETNHSLVYYANGSEKIHSLQKGVYTLSNEELDSPWAKQVEGKKKFESIIKDANTSTADLTDGLLDLLCDTTSYHPDPNVRDTGHPEQWMKSFNSVFVSIPEARYGTRTNSVILIDRSKRVTYTERTISHYGDGNDTQWTRNTFSFDILQ